MRCHFFAGLALGLALTGFGLSAVPAEAHRVNIFAYVENGEVIVECGFNRSQKVRQGRIEVCDAVTGAALLQGKTDEKGVFRFAVPAEAAQSGHDLRVQVEAGEGHQNDWIVPASEWKESSAPPAALVSIPKNVPATPAVPDRVGAQAAISATGRGDWATSADVERIVNAAVESRLAPIKRMLAEQHEAGPDFSDIIGGIGWIFGLVGVAAYFRRRP